MKSLFKKTTPLMIGLDIGTRQVKAVMIEARGNSYEVTACACEQIGKIAFADRELKEFEAVSQTLKKVKAALKTKDKDAVIAVSGSSVISKIVYMDQNQNDFELETQIEIEADSLIPYPLDEVYLDFEVMGPSESYPGKDNVLLTAAHKDMVDSRLLLVREIPFEPKIVDTEGNALGNAIAHFYAPHNTEKRVCCINIGASLLQLCVWENNEVIYSKEHSFGMNNLVQDLSAIHMLELEDAEVQLLHDKLPENWVNETLPIFASNLHQHINRALQMYVSTLHAKRPEKILLSGGGATLQPLIDMLRQDLDIELVVFNPFENMQVNDKVDQALLQKIAPQLSIAAGLASRSFKPWHI